MSEWSPWMSANDLARIFYVSPSTIRRPFAGCVEDEATVTFRGVEVERNRDFSPAGRLTWVYRYQRQAPAVSMGSIINPRTEPSRAFLGWSPERQAEHIANLERSVRGASPGLVYVITTEAHECICKIGYTERSPFLRCREFQIGSPVALRVHGFFGGSLSDESKAHRTYRKHRRHGEWFALYPIDLDRMIASHGGVLWEGDSIIEQDQYLKPLALLEGSQETT